MQSATNVQHCLPPLAAAFSFPSKSFDFADRVDVAISAAEHAVSVVFKRVRDALADGEGERNPLAMETLSGVIGTGISLLEALLDMAGQKKVEPAKQARLRSLLEEYKNLFEDIELFSTDITAEDCFRAACMGEAFSDLHTPEEDAAWQDL